MVKLLICLCATLTVAAVMLELRQQRMNLGYESGVLHRNIQRAQIKLWNQQLQIGVYTAPNAIEQTVRQYQLKLAPPAGSPTTSPVHAASPAPAGAGPLMESPDADPGE